jgi:hypothetical protein
MMPGKLLKIDALLARLDQEAGIETSARTVQRMCNEGMKYWVISNERHYDFDITYTHALKRAERQRNPEPRRRGRPRAA